MTTHCPHCGRVIRSSNKRIFESTSRTPLRQTAAPPLYPPPLEIQHPLGLPTMESNVHVPANQAIIAGCFCAPVVSLITSSLAVIVFKASTGQAILVGVIFGGITMFGVAAWQWFIKTAFYDSLLQQIETELDIDLDGDGDIGQTAIKTEVRVNNNWIYADLPHDRGNEKALVDFLAGVIAGTVTFSERGAADSGYSVAQFKKLRAVFIKSGFAYRKGKADNSPVVFTVAGNAVLRDIVNKPPPENYEGEGNRGMSGHYVERGSRRESWG